MMETYAQYEMVWGRCKSRQMIISFHSGTEPSCTATLRSDPFPDSAFRPPAWRPLRSGLSRVRHVPHEVQIN